MDEQEGMRCITLMQPVYERCRELCELADSNPDYRLAVVDTAWCVWQHVGDRLKAPRWKEKMFTSYSVVKMEGE